MGQLFVLLLCDFLSACAHYVGRIANPSYVGLRLRCVVLPRSSVWIVVLLALLKTQATARATAPVASAIPKAVKHRIVLLTDIGGDVDDMQSFTRFLLYADQYDIEGLIATSIRIFPNEKHRPIDGEPQPRYLVKWIKAYGEVRENLMKHSKGWPEPEALLTLIRKGVKTGRDAPFNIRTGIAGEASGHYPLEQLIGKGKDSFTSCRQVEYCIPPIQSYATSNGWIRTFVSITVLWALYVHFAMACWAAPTRKPSWD